MSNLIKVAFLSTGLIFFGLAGCKKAEEAAAKTAAAAKDGAKGAANAAAGAAKGAASQATGAAKGAASAAAGAVGGAVDMVKGAGDKAAYVKAAVAIGCAGKNITDKAKFNEKIASIQKAAGFDSNKWVTMAKEIAKDGEASKKIAEGIKSCK